MKNGDQTIQIKILKKSRFLKGMKCVDFQERIKNKFFIDFFFHSFLYTQFE